VERVNCGCIGWVFIGNVCGVWFMNKLPNGSIAVGSPGSNARNLSEIADSLLSTNHEQVLANKRENFKQILVEILKQYPLQYVYKKPELISEARMIAEEIVSKTFDEGIVN
jgi:hypothetical protein